MDITEFRIIRPPVHDSAGLLPLLDSVPDPRRPLTHVPPPITIDNIPGEVGSLDEDPLQRLPPGADGSLLYRMYEVLNGVNDFLRRSNDWVKGPALAIQIKALQRTPISEEEWLLTMAVAQVCMTELTVQAMAKGTSDGLTRAEELTRLALIRDLIALGAASLDTLDEAAVFARLNQRAVTLPERVTATVAGSARIELIRDATVADLHVIRREWACYVLGEVANIRNLMGGEKFAQTQTSLREQEAIETTDSERQERTEQEDSSKLATELSQEVNTQLNLSVNGYVDASVQYKTPVATINVAGGANVGLSMQRGERFASKVAREAVTRAVRTVDSRTRETRSQRELTRNEDVTRYELSNAGGNLSAVYRWVDRVDRYQLFRYPDRLQLEFQLPEPAEFYRKRSADSASIAASVNKPPDTFDLALEDITADKLLELAVTYQASNLPAIPDEEIALSQTLTLEVAKEALPGGDTVYNCPAKAKELEIVIPSNYQAVSVTYSGFGYPIWGNWRVGSVSVATQREGFHSGFATVSVGDNSHVSWVGGYREADNVRSYLASYGDVTDMGEVDSVQRTGQPGPDPVRSVPFGRATLVIGQDIGRDLQPDAVAAITFDPGVALSLRVGVSTAGLASSVVTFYVKCKRTDEAFLAWQLSVYDALFAAWSQWKREYNAAQLRQSLVGNTASDAGSQRNERFIREELKRQVISWLLDEEQFSGRPALRADKNDAQFNSIDFAKARESAPTIQFLEQAFEWGNMMYMFYPYFWAAGADWTALASQAANDPEFERFLRAGSARVVLPARPGFNDAVKNWLFFRVPFVTGQLPTPSDKLYVAIDREIRDLTSPWDGGIAEDWWEARVSTTLLYLQEESDFPIKNDVAVLPVEKNVMYSPGSICG